MKTLIIVLTTIFLTGCSVFGIRTEDQPSYQVLPGSRYSCEIFFRAPPRKISKDYSTANAFGCSA